MKVYVAGALSDAEAVREVQASVVAAGHEFTLDWTRESDSNSGSNYASDLELSATIAGNDLDAVLDADAVLVVASKHEGRGMLVELGAALTRASQGNLEHVIVVGAIEHETVFYYHSSVQRFPTAADWLRSLP